jgi:hypothetical protein
MNTHASFPNEIICTCGYLKTPAESEFQYNSSDLTVQIGSLLIALGTIFGSVPIFRLHIKPGTGELLISIGRKLVRSSGRSSRLYN